MSLLQVAAPGSAVQELRGPRGLAQVATWLGLQHSLDLLGTFPQLYHPAARSRRLGILAGDRLLAHLAYLDVTLRSPAGPARIRLIGGVTTDPAARGQGLASELMGRVIADAGAAEVDSLLLWSDLPGFYAHFGFAPAGRQYIATLHPGASAATSGTVRGAEPEDLPAILALHARKPVRVERDLATLHLQMQAAPMYVAVLERGGEVCAYACLEKGADFRGWWHEMGGSDADVATLIARVSGEQGLEETRVLIPGYRGGLPELLGATPAAPEPVGLRLALTARGSGELFVDGLDSV